MLVLATAYPAHAPAPAPVGDGHPQPRTASGATPDNRERLPVRGVRDALPCVHHRGVQSTIDGGEFKSFWEGQWWAALTVTTVGYGDITVTTLGGRIVAII